MFLKDGVEREEAEDRLAVRVWGACARDSEIRQMGLRQKLGNRGDRGADLLRRKEREEGGAQS